MHISLIGKYVLEIFTSVDFKMNQLTYTVAKNDTSDFSLYFSLSLLRQAGDMTGLFIKRRIDAWLKRILWYGSIFHSESSIKYTRQFLYRLFSFGYITSSWWIQEMTFFIQPLWCFIVADKSKIFCKSLHYPTMKHLMLLKCTWKYINNTPTFNIIISSPASAAYMRRWTGSALVQVMTCRLFGAKL